MAAAKENPFTEAKNTPKAQAAKALDDFFKKDITPPNSARILNSITLSYTLLSGALHNEKLEINEKIDWHSKLFLQSEGGSAKAIAAQSLSSDDVDLEKYGYLGEQPSYKKGLGQNGQNGQNGQASSANWANDAKQTGQSGQTSPQKPQAPASKADDSSPSSPDILVYDLAKISQGKNSVKISFKGEFLRHFTLPLPSRIVLDIKSEQSQKNKEYMMSGSYFKLLGFSTHSGFYRLTFTLDADYAVQAASSKGEISFTLE